MNEETENGAAPQPSAPEVAEPVATEVAEAAPAAAEPSAAEDSAPPAVQEPEVAAVAPAVVSGPAAAHGVLSEIEDGLKALEAFPENVLKWLRAKIAEAKSHL